MHLRTGSINYSQVLFRVSLYIICFQKIYKDDADSFIDDSECESEMSFNSKSSKSGGEVGFADEDAWRPKRVTRGAAKQ